MIEVTIPSDQLLELDLAMKRLDAEVLLKGEWVPFVDNVVEVVSVYPPVPQNSHYVRTGDLFMAWHAEQVDPLSAQVQNVAEYAGWVHGHEQTSQHKGTGWTQLYDKAKWLMGHFVEKIGDKAEAIWSA